ncbi:MAG: hypothetical protein LBD77_10655 [Bifidobacteriaceae bacterium]|jgi:hypothetical protein|nr:hypothetical protein [Bifidobacteriaceae bacterium]
MSAAPAQAPIRRGLPRPAAGRAAPAPGLRLVTAPPRRRGFVLYASACLTLLVGALAAVLWLNTALAAGAFKIHELEVELARLEVERDVMDEELVALAEPQALAAKATELGMIDSPATGYILLRDGRIVGAALAAGAEDDPDQTGQTDQTDQTDQAGSQDAGGAGGEGDSAGGE